MPLPFYSKRPDADFWDSHWQNLGLDIEAIVKKLEGSFLAKIMEEYLPKEGKILEGGCGLGQWILYFRRKGYDIEGIDFAENTIKWIKERFPDLPVKTGNILNLPYPDEYFSSYISLGVIEHFENGPEKALAEAYRVLENKGLFLCSVPYFNPVRRLKKKLFKSYHEQKEGEEFYQWAFAKKEIKNIIEAAGFQVCRIIPFDATKGIKDEIPGIRSIYKKFTHRSYKFTAKSDGNQVRRESLWKISQLQKHTLKGFLEHRMIKNLFGHMLLVIAEKQGKQL